ncbi:hypothetical protein [Roseiconus lacunae]|uniref:hypothetical protein n=1 Tax=Roseiconus lacunae TaxID=2605694 RepID=UPI0011F16602|nr:hypothetical protein [Roseiconus lacunae]
MRRLHSRTSPSAAVIAIATATIMAGGCRNTTTAPVGPLGQSTTLAPVQGGVPLSPIQPTSGISAFGAPTRVPPPSTGSYTVPGGYGSPSGSTYAPNPSTSSVPSGAHYGQAGFTSGVTNLSPTGNLSSPVRQTGWVADDPQGLPVQPAYQAPPATPASAIRSGGMQVIDLTGSPYPPGYVPPQNRPGVSFDSTGASLPQTAPYPNATGSNFTQTQYTQTQYSAPPQYNLQSQWSGPDQTQNAISSGNAALGQPQNSTFVSSSNSFSDQSAEHTASLPPANLPSANLPTTDPLVPADDSSLQWRRPSPRF